MTRVLVTVELLQAITEELEGLPDGYGKIILDCAGGKVQQIRTEKVRRVKEVEKT